MKFNKQDVLWALEDSGLERGDTVFITTGLGMLGRPDGVSSAEELNQFFFDCFRELLGDEGTILIPTYSYTFGGSTLSKPVLYDPAKTPAKIGPFPEFFRQQSGVQRTLDPMMSVSGLGPACDDLFKALPKTSYGKDSIFDRLIKTEAKCCSVGLGANWTPFIHHLDWLMKVPFRYDKIFFGQIKADGKIVDTTWNYFVRMPFDASWPNAHRIGKAATDSGIWRFSPLGRVGVGSCHYREYFEFVRERQKQDSWLLAMGPPCDPLDMERERIGHVDSNVTIPCEGTALEILNIFAEQPRHCLSAEISGVLNAVQICLPIQIHSFPSGTLAYDWIVPERWTFERAAIKSVDGQKTYLSTDQGDLGVQFYSLPFSGSLSRADLLHKLQSSPQNPDAIPYRQVRGWRDWQLCCSEKSRETLIDDEYFVEITTCYSYDTLQVGDLQISGKSSKTVLICTYIDDAYQANNRLSGMAVALRAIKNFLDERPSPNISYRLLILPGPEGLAAWMKRHQDRHTDFIGAMVFCMMAKPLPFTLEQTHPGAKNSRFLERCHEALDKHSDANLIESGEQSLFDWLPSGSNPSEISLKSVCHFPMVTIARTLPPSDPHFPFMGYETDRDALDTIDTAALEDSCHVMGSFLLSLDEQFQ